MISTFLEKSITFRLLFTFQLLKFTKPEPATFIPCGLRSCNLKHEECINGVCECKPGWSGPLCDRDMDECLELNPKPCAFPGGYCVDRFLKNNRYSCNCDTSAGHWRIGEDFDNHGPTSCIDVNECIEWTNPCHAQAFCENIPGSYNCTCRQGFLGDGFKSCAPIPFETVNPPTCADLACDTDTSYCEDLENYPVCRCLDGYFQFNGRGKCYDINECVTPRLNNCDRNAFCLNIPGSYYCACMEGSIDVSNDGDGTKCRNINECTEGTHNCKGGKVCVDKNPPQKFECIDSTLSPSVSPTFKKTSDTLDDFLRSSQPTTQVSVSTITSEEISKNPTPSMFPSVEPSLIPTITSSSSHSKQESLLPSQTKQPSLKPSITTTLVPSTTPSTSSNPSIEPSTTLSTVPSHFPFASTNPSIEPSPFPSISSTPSVEPSPIPTLSTNPSVESSSLPSANSYPNPTVSMNPSVEHSLIPTIFRSSSPTASTIPSAQPSSTPSQYEIFLPPQTQLPSLKTIPKDYFRVPLELKLKTDDVGRETSYRLYDILREKLIWKNETLTSNTLINEKIFIEPEGCYFFVLHDLFVDGLCCSFGLGDFELLIHGTEIALYEFGDATDGDSFRVMAYSYIGSSCESMPLLPSFLDSSCEGFCGSFRRPTGCSCDCIMNEVERSDNKKTAVNFGDCCPDYVSKCSATKAPVTETPLLGGKIFVSYVKRDMDSTVPKLSVFDKKGLIGIDSCEPNEPCKILIEIDIANAKCEDLLVILEEMTGEWIYPEDITISVNFDGTYVLYYEGNIFPGVLQLDCSQLS